MTTQLLSTPSLAARQLTAPAASTESASAVSDGQVGTHSFAPDLLALLAARVGETLQRWARRRAERLFVTRERQQRAFVLDSQLDAALRLHEARAFDARRAL